MTIAGRYMPIVDEYTTDAERYTALAVRYTTIVARYTGFVGKNMGFVGRYTAAVARIRSCFVRPRACNPQLDTDEIPVVTVTPASPNADFYVAEKNNRGFKVVRMSSDREISFDWSAFARVEVEVAGSDIDHIDDLFHRESFDIPRGDYKEFVAYIGELKDTISSYDPNKVYPVDMAQILKDNEERRLQEQAIARESIAPADTVRRNTCNEEYVPPPDNYIPASNPDTTEPVSEFLSPMEYEEVSDESTKQK